MPVDRAARVPRLPAREIGILPIWVCPIRARRRARRFPLYPLRPGTLYINFGFWDVVPRRLVPRPAATTTARSSARSRELGGIKSLYSDSYYREDEFWAIYDGEAYAALKRKYDPQRRLGDLYAEVRAAPLTASDLRTGAARREAALGGLALRQAGGIRSTCPG